MQSLKIEEVKKRIWWSFLEEDLQELLKESFLLWEKVGSWKEKFNDYSFVVFPAAKAYEGYLKVLFLKMRFITEEEYYGKHFRIGKALNPSLPPRLKDENSVYQKLTDFCKGEDIPKAMWNAWKVSRNLLFHWFPDEKNQISYVEAGERLDIILKAMDEAFKGCKIK